MGASGLFVWDPTQNTYALKDDFSLNKGKHSIKFGFNLNERRLYFQNQSVDKGRVTFDNIFSPRLSAREHGLRAGARRRRCPSGRAWICRLSAGAATGAFLELRGVVWHGHQRYWGGYVQDTWQIHPRLTLNFGLRYEQWPAWLLPRNNTVRYSFEGNGGLEYAL